MAKDSNCGNYQKEQVIKLCNKIMTNRSFINQDDIKVLEFLSTKGDYENQKIKLVPKK